MRSRYVGLFGAFAVLAMSGAWASGGRINFSGAVVEPTCSFGSAQRTAVQAAPATRAASHQRCGQSAHSAGRGFTHQVLTVDAAMASGDRLLGHFASYAPRLPSGGHAAQLVLRTYD